MPNYDDWKRLYEQELIDYREHFAKTGDYFGYFSVPKYKTAADIGIVIREYCKGQPCLDIGCGALKRPVYMLPDMDFTGIDPDPGVQERSFPFKQALGEDIPYPDCHFGCVTIMSILDHVLDPDKVLSEAHRVLKPNGYVFIWYTDKFEPDGHHLYFFSRSMIDELLVTHGFVVVEQQFYPHGPGYPDTMLAVGRKE